MTSRKPRIRLSVGPPGPLRVIMRAAAAVLITINIALLLLYIFVAVPAATAGDEHWSVKILVAVLITLVILVGMYVIGAGTYILLGIARSREWLIGTVLGARHGFRTISIDLAAADIRFDDVLGGIVVTDPQTGRVIERRVDDGVGHLPSPELLALADAIAVNPAATNQAVSRKLRDIAVR